MMDNILARPFLTAMIVGGADRYMYNNMWLEKNAALATSVFGGFMVAELVSVYALPRTEYKGLKQLALEVTVGSCAAIFLDTMVLEKGVFRQEKMTKRFITIGLADIFATGLRDVLMNRLQ